MEKNSSILVERIVTHNPHHTIEFGRNFAQRLSPADVVALSGSLGSGKTTFIRGICEGLEVSEMVTSPTFTLINEYRGRLPIYHFDFYRLHDTKELEELGLQEYFYGEGVCLIEWPELVEQLLPPHYFLIRLYHLHELSEIDLRGFDLKKFSSDLIENVTAKADGAASVMVPNLKDFSDHRLIEVYEYGRAGH